MIRKLLFGLFPVVLLGVTLSAQQASERYSFSSLVEMALRNRSALHSADALNEKSVHLRKAVQSAYGPTIVANAELILFNDEFKMPVVSDDPLNLPNVDPDIEQAITDAMQQLINPLPVRGQTIFHAGVTLVQPITRIYSIYQQSQALKGMTAKTKAAKELLQRRITYTVTLSALAVLEAQEGVVIAENNLNSLKAIAVKARAFVDAGSVAEYVALVPESAVSIAQSELDSAQNVLSIAASVLARSVGAKVMNITNIMPISADPPAPPMPLDKALSYAEQHDPRLRIFRSTEESATHNEKAMWWQFLPQIGLAAHYDFRHNIYLVPEHEFSIGLNASWELLSWGRRYHLLQSQKSTALAAQWNAQEVAETAKRATHTAWIRLHTIPKRLQAIRQSIAAAEAVVKARKAKFDEGEEDIAELIRAENKLHSLKALEAQTKYNGWRQFISLKMALGEGFNPTIEDNEAEEK